MGAAALPILIAATAVQAVGSIQQGQAAKSAADSSAQAMEYNAAADRARAVQASAMAGVKEDEQRRQGRASIGEQLASSASAGAGLNSDLLRQSIFNVDSDTNAIRYEGQLKAAGLNDQAAISMHEARATRSRGSSAESAGYLNAAGSLLNGGSAYYAGKKTPGNTKGIY
jgi:hypothetical protein